MFYLNNMFVLCMIFVLEIFLMKDAMFMEQMPPKLLEMSLMHVNSLLADVAKKISIERDLLYKVDNETEKVTEPEPAMCQVPQQSQAPQTTKKRIILKRIKRKKRPKKQNKKVISQNKPHSKVNLIQNLRTLATQVTRETTTGEAKLSEMLQDIFPESPFGAIPWSVSDMRSDNAIQSNQTFEIERRWMINDLKHLIKYNKLIQHLISKHPKLFHKLVMHYEHSQRQKRRHLRRKKHNHKHHPNKGIKYEYSEPDLSKSNELHNISIDDLADNEVSSKSHEQSVQIEYLNEPVKLKRHKVELGTFYRGNKINSSMAVGRFIANNTVRISRKNHDKKANLLNMSEIYATTTKFHLNNTVLKNILEDSSYSDEEVYLKTMLMDAFFHGNGSSAKDMTK